MSVEYLLLPRLEIQAANAQSAWWLINAAPVMAANLFAHNLGLKTGRRFPRGVGLFHHDAQILGERFYGKLQPQQRRGAVFIDDDDYSSKNRHALSLQPTATCHLVLSLLLAYDDGLPRPSAVSDFLQGARLAGGQIVRYGQPGVFGTAEAVRKRLRGGSWLVERMDLLEGVGDEGDALDAMIRACTQPNKQTVESAGADSSGRAEGGRTNFPLPNSWIVPTTLGYAALTDFAKRAGAREGYPHAYAEPLVGLVQYVSPRNWADRPLPLWRGHWPREDVFVVTQKEI